MKYNDNGEWKDVQVKVANAIQNEYGESTSDGYSQEYLNDKLVNIGTSVDSSYRTNILHSKNLFNQNGVWTNHDVTYTFSKQRLTLNGTSNDEGGYIGLSSIPQLAKLSAGTYTLSINEVSGTRSGSANVVIRNLDANTNFVDTLYEPSNTYTFTLTTETRIGFNLYQLGSGRVYTNYVIDLQLEEGSTATTYEPYVIPSIVVDNDAIYSKPVVLWQNNSPTSNFASQSVSLIDAIENYDYYEVIFKESTTSSTYKSCKLPVGLNMRMEVDIGFMFIRIVNSMSGTSMGFTDCVYYNSYGSAATTNQNSAVIPYQIIGYGRKNITSSSNTRNVETRNIVVDDNDDEGEIVRGEET